MTDHHRFLLRLHLGQIDALDEAIGQIDQEAVCAVAASMLTAVYHMLKNGTEYEDLGADHFDRRSNETKANRLVDQLAKLGFQVELQPLAVTA